MRIAQVCPPWLAVPPKGYGGIEWVVSLIADGLADAGHDVTLFATGDSETHAKLEFILEQAPGSAHINDIMLDATHTMFALRDAARRFDVLHVHSPFSTLAAAVETAVPVVHTLHGSFSPGMTRLYDLVARYRYRFFGKRDQCLLPPREYRSRFLDDDADVTNGAQ